ncbi:hypothetical protein ACOSQ2_008979 [Xanthoceras sorbifolium]
MTGVAWGFGSGAWLCVTVVTAGYVVVVIGRCYCCWIRRCYCCCWLRRCYCYWISCCWIRRCYCCLCCCGDRARVELLRAVPVFALSGSGGLVVTGAVGGPDRGFSVLCAAVCCLGSCVQLRDAVSSGCV